jgi:hypothetical protein
MKVVRLSALRTGHLYPPGSIPGTHFCWRLSRPQGHSAVGRIRSMKNFNDTIGNRNCDLPACSAVPQPTEPLLTLSLLMSHINAAPSTARNLTYICGWDFLLGILLLEQCISLIYAYKTNKYTYYSFSLLIMYGSSVAHHVTIHNTPIHNILSTAPQLSIYQKALGTLPEDGTVIPTHVGATEHN